MPSLGGSGEYGGDDPSGGASMGSGGYGMFAGDYGGGQTAADIADPIIASNKARNEATNPVSYADVDAENTATLAEMGLEGFNDGSDQAAEDVAMGLAAEITRSHLNKDRARTKALIMVALELLGQDWAKELVDYNMSTEVTMAEIEADMAGDNVSGSDSGSGEPDGPAGNVDSGGNIGSGDGSGGGGGSGTGWPGGVGGGGTADDPLSFNNPLSYDFWDSFIDEWMDAKDMYQQDDAFKKSQVEPAIGKYQDALSGLTDQANAGTGPFRPTTFGMGNFRSSFVPKSGHLMADRLKDYAKEGLTSSLALTDVMQPNKGNMDYLNQLQQIAMFEKEKEMQKYGIDKGYAGQIDSIKEQTSDKGSWLDIVKDVVQIGDTVGDAWNKYF